MREWIVVAAAVNIENNYFNFKKLTALHNLSRT